MTRLELLTEMYLKAFFSDHHEGKHERINRIKKLIEKL